MLERGELASAVAFASNGNSKRPVVPVLAGMRVSAGDGRVTFAAFDYETAARAACEAETQGTGSVLVSGGELRDAVKALPAGKRVTVALSVWDDGLVLEADGVRLTVAHLGSEAEAEYPALPPMPEARGIVAGDVFARSVARVAACAGTDDTLPALTCLHAEFTTGAMRLAATDRYTLAVDDVAWTSLADGKSSALVPARAMAVFAKAAAKSGKVTVCASEARFGEQRETLHAMAGFTDGMRELVVHQNSGTFPKYRDMLRMADEAGTVVTADAGQLAAAVTRAGKVTGRNERMGFDVAGDCVTLTALRDGQCTSTQVVAAEVTGEPVETGFNPAYLASLLSGIAGEVSIGIVSPNKPVIVSGDGFTGLVVPIRLAQ